MPVLTRSLSAGSSNRPYLTPQTPPSIHARALIDMTPLPSLFDKMVEAAKLSKRSASLQLRSKVDDNKIALPSIPEETEGSSPSPVRVHDVRQSSDAPTTIEDDPEPEPVVHPLSDISDYMDFEDTPIVFSGPVHPTPPPVPIVLPPAPAPVFPLVHEEVVTRFPPPNPVDIYPGPPAALPPINHESLLSELTNSATFPYHTTYYNPPSTSEIFGSNTSLQDQTLFQLPQVSEGPPQIQIPTHDTVRPQYPTHPPPIFPTALPVLFASAPVHNTMQPTVLPVLAQSLPAFPAIPVHSGPYPQRQEQDWSHPPRASAQTSYPHHTFISLIQQREDLENIFASWFHPRPRLSNWRIREIERQKEMDQIAEPYIARLREVSRQKKADAEARALAGQQRADQAKKESGDPLRHIFEEDEKKTQKKLKEIERQQRSEEKRQARRRRRSTENTLSEVQETEVRISPRRRSSGRSKPYSIPHPATRSPRRSHVMPGGFGSDDLTSDQTGLTSDDLWKGLRSAVDLGYRLWTQD